MERVKAGQEPHTFAAMARSRLRPVLFVTLALLHCLAHVAAGPVGAPSALSAGRDLSAEGGNNGESVCEVGTMVYLAGQSVPAAGACDRCTCGSDGRVRCERERCEPRPGCKALHRPDHCCPTYQCECEQDGRRYGNGEKLVDPQDPCRVCYCQGGEVVCRRIACFRRDDCRPRHVPGRCCPEYDHCPLRGMPPEPSTTFAPNVTPIEAAPPRDIKQEITIKEITPVSEIPVITEVKIKEVPPSPSAEAVDYISSRAPLISRETDSTAAQSADRPSITTAEASPDDVSEIAIDTDTNKNFVQPYSTGEPSPSKVSLSMSSSVHYLFGGPDTSSAAVPSTPPEHTLDDDEPAPFEHSPAFPPLPDDLSVPTDRDDDIAPDHNTGDVTQGSLSSPSPTPVITTGTASFAEGDKSIDMDPSGYRGIHQVVTAFESSSIKSDQLLHSRSATRDETSDDLSSTSISTSTDIPESTTHVDREVLSEMTTGRAPHLERRPEERHTTIDNIVTTISAEVMQKGTISDRNVPTQDLTSPQSDTSPGISESISQKSDITITTMATPLVPSLIPKIRLKTTSNFTPTTVAPGIPDVKRASESTRVPSFDKVETTEINLISSDIATETDESTSAAEDFLETTVRPQRSNKNNMLADLIDLVGDVASIGERRPPPSAPSAHSAPTATAESEEFIPVNAGYKSKNSNRNLNSITEIPDKSRWRPSGVELEDDETEGATDSQTGDRVEPTTQRPHIDRVTAGTQPSGASGDIEIITQAYVPALPRRPTKVVQANSAELAAPAEPSVAPTSAEFSAPVASTAL